MRLNSQWLILFFVCLSLSTLGQKKPVKKTPTQKQPVVKPVAKADPAEDEKKVRDMISFLEFMLNTLGNSTTPSRDKDVLITESYSKIFRDSKVQIEDDLDEERVVVTNKDVVAYLKDVNFFFKEVRFEFVIEDIKKSVTSSGEEFYKISTTRNLKGTTVDQKTVNSTQPRFIEINYNPADQDLKIVSIYTSEYNEKDELLGWWKNLSLEWKSVFRNQLNLSDSVSISDLKKLTSLSEINIANNSFILNLEPLSRLNNLTKLNISGTQVADLTPIRNLTELIYLDVSNTTISQLSPLKYAGKIETMILNNTRVIDLSILARMSHLKHLELKDVPVNNISVLQNNSLLEKLNLSNTQISDITPLTNLTNVSELNLTETYVQDIEAIKSMKELRLLTLDSTHIKNLNVMSGLNNLKILSINHTPVSDLSPLLVLSNLEKVYCDHTLVKRSDADSFMAKKFSTLIIFDSQDLKAWWDLLSTDWKKSISITARINENPTKEELARVPGIDSINVSGKTNIKDLAPLTKLQRLRVLIADNTSIGDLTPLRSHQELIRMDISNTQIKDLSVIGSLKKLTLIKANQLRLEHAELLRVGNVKTLYADQSGITNEVAATLLNRNPECLLIYKTEKLKDWWGALSPTWKGVFEKSFSKGQTASTENLHRLTQQKALQFSDVPITDLSPLREFIQLTDLQFSGTNLTSISPIESIIRLKILKASNSPIIKIDSLAQLTELEELDISNTPVSDIYPIWKLNGLKKLNCAGTQIKRMDALEKLEMLEFLDCSNTSVTKLDALDYLPLKTLKCFNTKVSTRTIENFKASHPNCQVIYYR